MYEEIKIKKLARKHITDVKIIEKECGVSVWSKADYLAEISRKDSLSIVAESIGKPVGFLVSRLIMSGIAKNDYSNEFIPKNELEIYNIAVKPAYKNIGIGSKLLNWAVSKASEQFNVRNIWLEVRTSNFAAINFYKRNNFHIIYTRKNFYTSPTEDGFVLKLELK